MASMAYELVEALSRKGQETEPQERANHLQSTLLHLSKPEDPGVLEVREHPLVPLARKMARNVQGPHRLAQQDTTGKYRWNICLTTLSIRRNP
jgi:hypothetical protein